MRGGDVEGVEIVVDILDLRPARNAEAEPAEQVDQFVGCLSEGMTMPEAGCNSRQGDINPSRGYSATLQSRPGGARAASRDCLTPLNR